MSEFKPESSSLQYNPLKTVVCLWAITLILCYLFPSFTYQIIMPLIVILSVLILIPIPIYQTMKYNISNSDIEISFLWYKKKVPFNSISSIKKCIPERVFKFRKLGIGIPLFLRFGRYTGDYGNVTAYVTSGNRVVLIELNNGQRYAISPKETDDFIEYYEIARAHGKF